MLGDMGHGIPFRAGIFDGCISISAVQWLCNADKKSHNPPKRLYAFFKMRSSDFGDATIGYGTVDFSTDEIRAEEGVGFNSGPNWDQSPDLQMGQEILFNGGERISSKFMTSFDLPRSQF